MATIKFIATDINGCRRELFSVTSYQISRDYDAACDGLRVSYSPDALPNELCSIEAYSSDKRIFNGYIDTQRDTTDNNGTSCFIYARSSACLLTDNEATPRTYDSPSALALYTANAKDYGFICDLPRVYSKEQYQVSKGTSCYRAIAEFVEGICGGRVVVDANNCITLLGNEEKHIILSDGVISEKRIINRGDAITEIDYKIKSSNLFDHHIKSRFFEKRGIRKSKKENLSTLPIWQKEYMLKNMLADSARSYKSIELVLDGAIDINLGDRVDYLSRNLGKCEDMLATSVCHYLDSNGERTKIVLSLDIDLEEIIYVD